jgi:hypothetical protein
MRLNKSIVENWLRRYRRFFFACCWWCPLAALVFVTGYALTPRSYAASTLLLWLFSLSGTALFVVAGGYSALTGVSLFYCRCERKRTGAICGLIAGLLFGVFSAALGISVLSALR